MDPGEGRRAARRRREALGEGEDEDYSSHGAEHRAAFRAARLLSRVGCYFAAVTQRQSGLAKMDTPVRDAYLGLGGTM